MCCKKERKIFITCEKNLVRSQILAVTAILINVKRDLIAIMIKQLKMVHPMRSQKMFSMHTLGKSGIIIFHWILRLLANWISYLAHLSLGLCDHSCSEMDFLAILRHLWLHRVQFLHAHLRPPLRRDWYLSAVCSSLICSLSWVQLQMEALREQRIHHFRAIPDEYFVHAYSYRYIMIRCC